MNKFRVTLTEEDLNKLLYGRNIHEVVDKIARAYHKGQRQKAHNKYRSMKKYQQLSQLLAEQILKEDVRFP